MADTPNTEVVAETDEPIVPTTPDQSPTDDATETPQPASTMAPAAAWVPSGKLSPRARRRRIRLGIFAAIVAVYAAGFLYFSSHFVPGTTVDGVEAGLMSIDELTDALNGRAATYQLQVSDANGFEATFVGADYALAAEGARVAEEAHDRTTPALWIPSCLTPPHLFIDPGVSFDEEALTTLVNQAVEAYNAEATPPTDASASYDAEAGKFVIADDALGTKLDATKVYDACVRASHQLQAKAPLDDSVLARPRLTRINKELLSTVGFANEQLEHPLVLAGGDATVLTLDAPTMAGFMSITGDPKITVDAGKVYSFVEGSEALQDAGNAYDEEHVWVLDVEETADAIVNALANDTSKPVELVRELIETKPAATPGARERGRHIDVNLSTQFARFYDTDGKVIWESYFVSGNLAEGRGTPTGDFAIEAKVNGTTLVGADENGDGQPDYESFVSYWMPFLAGDWGLHDATWRWDGEFGGNTYTWNGSHGCINLPYYAAERLFGLCEVGDPVIVHW